MTKRQSFELVVSKDGTIRSIYSDSLAELYGQGDNTITRASMVEPLPSGNWIADMSPAIKRYHLECDNPILGPFTLRSEALDAERGWLRARLFGGGDARSL